MSRRACSIKYFLGKYGSLTFLLLPEVHSGLLKDMLLIYASMQSVLNEIFITMQENFCLHQGY